MLVGVDESMLGSEDGWLQLLPGTTIVPIQILRFRIEPVVPTINAIRIKHWNYFENEFVHQDLLLNQLTWWVLLFACEKFQNSIQNI